MIRSMRLSSMCYHPDSSSFANFTSSVLLMGTTLAVGFLFSWLYLPPYSALLRLQSFT